MSEFLFFGLMLVGVVAVGAVWMLRSAVRPASEDEDPDGSVAVRGPGTHMEMEVFRSKLESAGIFAYARNRDGPIMPGAVAPQLFGWELLVRQGDAGAAEKVLAGEEAELPSAEPQV
jgi:hypothetical protein